MKKNKKRLYKRLPKYALGTMKPIDLGYQPGRGIGSAHAETQQGISLEPETQALRANTIPQSMQKMAGYAPYITQMATGFGSKAATTGATNIVNNGTPFLPTTSTTTVPTMDWSKPLQDIGVDIGKSTASGVAGTTGAAAASTAGTAAANAATTAATTAVSNIGSTAGSTLSELIEGAGGQAALSDSIAGVGNLGAEIAASDIGKQALQNVSTKAGSGALQTVGTALGVVGSAYGALNMGMDIANFGSHRSASDILASSGKQFYTTDKGNQYQTYTGVNAGQEMAYENASARAKQLGFAIDSVGTGASLGGLIGSTALSGSIGGLPGMAIGALGGLLLGGLGSLFGWGDNSDEIERITRNINDNIAMYNRQEEAVARSKDVAAEFNDRQGVAAAKIGKSAYGPMSVKKGDNINTPRLLFDVNAQDNTSIGIPKSKLAPRETVYNKENIENWGRVPGKGNNDTVYSAVSPGDSTVVITNRGGLSDLAAAVLKSNAPEKLKQWQLTEIEKEQTTLQESELENNMKKHKNGKLPGFESGWVDYLMTGMPHLAALGTSWNQYNRAKYADMPDYPGIVDSGANTQAINILGRRRFNVDPILDQLHNTYRESLYDINRTPGLGAGGQAVARANAASQLNKQKTAAMVQADEINNKYTADYANALANYGKWMSEMMTNNNYARAAFRQQQNAAREGWMAQYEKNGLTALADLAKDVMGVRQFGRSEDYQDRILGLYGKQVANEEDKIKAIADQAEQARLDREAAYRNTIKTAAESAQPTFFNQGLFGGNGPWNLWGAYEPVQLSVPGINPRYMKYFSKRK